MLLKHRILILVVHMPRWHSLRLLILIFGELLCLLRALRSISVPSFHSHDYLMSRSLSIPLLSIGSTIIRFLSHRCALLFQGLLFL